MLEDLARAPAGFAPPRRATEPCGHTVEHRPVAFAEGLPGTVHGLLEKHFILRGAAHSANVSAVHRKVHDQRLQHPADRAEGQVTRHQVIAGHLQQGLGNAFKVTGQQTVEDLLARQLRFFDKRGGAFGAPLPQLTEDVFAVRIVLQQRQLVHELVTGGAVHGPVTVQGFAGTEDLLDVDRQMPARREQVEAPTQLAAITPGIGEAVDVVDA